LILEKTMIKTILIFSDGTGNSSASVMKTNVWRVYDALDLSAEKGQIAYYDNGVGSSSSKFLAALGGAVGLGLKRNVLDIYKFLSRHYGQAKASGTTPHIACFGFSRGAFTVRLLTGLVESQGLLDAASEAELERQARCAYRAYRRQNFHTIWRIESVGYWLYDNLYLRFSDPKSFRHKPYDKTNRPPQVDINFLGLWDTVGAYGMPIEEMRKAIDDWIFPLTFSGFKLSRIVKIARHALSIDDERDAFTPILFEETENPAPSENLNSRRLVQVWFAGVHANVGGGYPDDSMSAAPLRWIMKQASEHGVAFRDEARKAAQEKATPFGQMYDSRAGFGALYRYAPRDIDSACNDPYKNDPKKAVHDWIVPIVHPSVVFRMAIGFDGYAPIALPKKINVLDSDGSLLPFEAFQQKAVEMTAGRPAVSTVDAGLKALAQAVTKLRQPATTQLELVRNAVFWRRATYYATIVPLLLLLAAPLLEPEPVDSQNPISTFLTFVGGLLPVYFSPWFKAFQEHPFYVLIFVVVTVASYGWGAHLKVLIGDRARAAWGMLDGDPNPNIVNASIWDRLAHRILNTAPLVRLWEILALNVAPTIIAFAFVFGVLPMLGDRVVFQIESYFGGICRGTQPESALRTPDASRTLSFVFNASNPCQASGIKLTAGQEYAINFEITPDAEWTDGGKAADLSGLQWSTFNLWEKANYAVVGPLFRRVFSQPWFKPMLRVGERGFAESAAEPSTPFEAKSSRNEMTTLFRAPTTGELFVFVNDAYPGVFPFAWLSGISAVNADGSWRHAYGDNTGSATVSIRRTRSDVE
jgi:uncharacterized protein (DUF2235 family)